MLKQFCILLILLLNLSCSRVRFQSKGIVPVTTAINNVETEQVEISGEVIFYAWGNYPAQHIINIDDEFKKRGFSYVSDPRIEEYQTFFNYFLTALSFGMYNPRNYRVTGLVIKESNRYDF